MSRRHGAELESAIAAAVMAELADRGYSGVTYDGVAVRAKTSKPVLYRRWASKAEMVLAAVMASSTRVVTTPKCGDLAQDLKALLHSMRENFGAGRATMLGLLAELDEGSADSVRELLSTWGAHLVEPVVASARDRGELGTSDIPQAVLVLPFDLGRYELAIRGVLPEERIADIVDTVVMPLLALHSNASQVDQAGSQSLRSAAQTA